MRCLMQRLLFTFAVLLLGACSSAVRWEEPTPRGTPAGAEVRARPEWHTVRQGETLYAIAFRYALRADSLAAWNNLGDGTRIGIGQRLRLSPPRAAPIVAAPGGTTAPVRDAPPRWQWPVAGPVLARFGESPLTASGIQLGGRAGDPVRAAASGQVVYAGNGLAGYGDLLIIKHNATWLSAYGYNQSLLVREGDRVAAGQTIARMGEGPSAAAGTRRPVLHFEIRRNGAPVDPMAELPRSP